MDSSFKDVLTRASKIAGTDLFELFSRQQSEIDEVRNDLPRKARKKFDEELKSQKVSPTDKRRIQAIINNKKNKTKIKKLERALERYGIKNPVPREISFHLERQSKIIISDHTGWAARFYSRICPHKIGVGLVHRAALSYDQDGKPRYSYAGNSRGANRARSILAYGLLLIGLSSPTGRKGQGWSRIVKKIPMDAFLAIFTDPSSGETPHRNTIGGGIHRESSDEETSGKVGYLSALRNVGLVYTRQAKWRPGENPADLKGWADIEPEEMAGGLHPSGWYTSLLRYWIVTDRFTEPRDAAKQAKLWIAWLSGNIPWHREEDGSYTPSRLHESTISKPKKPPD
jgi:hypothetical protein